MEALTVPFAWSMASSLSCGIAVRFAQRGVIFKLFATIFLISLPVAINAWIRALLPTWVLYGLLFVEAVVGTIFLGISFYTEKKGGKGRWIISWLWIGLLYSAFPEWMNDKIHLLLHPETWPSAGFALVTGLFVSVNGCCLAYVAESNRLDNDWLFGLGFQMLLGGLPLVIDGILWLFLPTGVLTVILWIEGIVGAAAVLYIVWFAVKERGIDKDSVQVTILPFSCWVALLGFIFRDYIGSLLQPVPYPPWTMLGLLGSIVAANLLWTLEIRRRYNIVG